MAIASVTDEVDAIKMSGQRTEEQIQQLISMLEKIDLHMKNLALVQTIQFEQQFLRTSVDLQNMSFMKDLQHRNQNFTSA